MFGGALGVGAFVGAATALTSGCRRDAAPGAIDAGAGSSRTVPAAPTAPAAPDPAAATDLERDIRALVALAETDPTAAATGAARLLLPDPAAFFAAHFDASAAARLATEYTEAMKTAPSDLATLLGAQRGKGRSELLVERFTDPTDPGACGYQENALRAARVPLALYSVRLLAPGASAGLHVYSFVRVGDTWRLAGPMKQAKPQFSQEPTIDTLAGLRAREREEYFRSGKLP
jgi:hypothetical protein